MSSSSNNNFSCSRTFTDRRPVKWLSSSCNKKDYSSVLKEKLRLDCLEKARKRRLERTNRVRSTAAMPNSWNTPSPRDNSPNEYSVEAQQLIQETLWSVEKSCYSTPSPSFHTESSSFTGKTAIRTPIRNERVENPKTIQCIYGSNNNIFSTPDFGYSWPNNSCYFSESELLRLMQEVQEELQREGV